MFSKMYENEVKDNSSFQKLFLRTTLYIAPPFQDVIYCNKITIEMKNFQHQVIAVISMFRLYARR